MEFSVDLLSALEVSLAVLSHLEARGRNSTRVSSLTGGVKDLVGLVLRVLFDYSCDVFEDLVDCLVEDLLVGILLDNAVVYSLNVTIQMFHQ